VLNYSNIILQVVGANYSNISKFGLVKLLKCYFTGSSAHLEINIAQKHNLEFSVQHPIQDTYQVRTVQNTVWNLVYQIRIV